MNPQEQEYTFHNVTISILAPSAAEAYTMLTDALATAGGDCEWTTDTVTRGGGEEIDTRRVMPEASDPYEG